MINSKGTGKGAGESVQTVGVWFLDPRIEGGAWILKTSMSWHQAHVCTPPPIIKTNKQTNKVLKRKTLVYTNSLARGRPLPSGRSEARVTLTWSSLGQGAHIRHR